MLCWEKKQSDIFDELHNGFVIPGVYMEMHVDIWKGE